MSKVKGIPFADFDPNNLDGNYTLWAVWTGAHLKTFSTRPAALNCFSSWPTVKLYEYVPGKAWVERAVKDPSNASDVCDRCGTGRLKDTYGNWDRLDAAFQWERRNGKITSPPNLLHVCKPCVGFVRNG